MLTTEGNCKAHKDLSALFLKTEGFIQLKKKVENRILKASICIKNIYVLV